MGASSWTYYVPYQEDVEQALQTLRKQIFEEGNYLAYWHMFEYERKKDDLCLKHGIDRTDHDAVKKLLQEKGPIQITQPQDISEALKRSECQGSHSILDIDCISSFSNYYEGLGISKTIIQHFFDSKKPTSEVVTALVSDNRIWPTIEGLVEYNDYYRARPEQFNMYELPDDVLRFLRTERTQQDTIDMFVSNEAFWIAIYEHLYNRVDFLLHVAVQGALLPFPQEKLFEFCHTDKPTKEIFEEAQEGPEIWEIIRRWMGYYTTIYKDGIPHELVFIGCSGD